MTTPRSRLIYRLLSSLVGVLVGVYLVIVIGMYGFSWRGPLTTRLARWIPVPVANVGWHLISAETFLVQYQAMTHNNDVLTATSRTAFPAKTTSQNVQLAASKIIRDADLALLLRRWHLSISNSDIDQAYQAQVAQTGNPGDITSVIKHLYNWTPEQFKRYVIWTVVAQEKIQEKLSFDSTTSASAQRQAENVLSIIKTSKQSFQDIAKAYSDDAQGANGGDMGFIARGTLVKEVDDVAFSLAVNEVSPVIHSKYGFHIIKVLERKTENGQDQARLLEIFIAAPSVDQYVTKDLQQRRVALWLPAMRWDAAHGQAAVNP